jgi:hypothetical protein
VLDQRAGSAGTGYAGSILIAVAVPLVWGFSYPLGSRYVFCTWQSSHNAEQRAFGDSTVALTAVSRVLREATSAGGPTRSSPARSGCHIHVDVIPNAGEQAEMGGATERFPRNSETRWGSATSAGEPASTQRLSWQASQPSRQDVPAGRSVLRSVLRSTESLSVSVTLQPAARLMLRRFSLSAPVRIGLLLRPSEPMHCSSVPRPLWRVKHSLHLRSPRHC